MTVKKINAVLVIASAMTAGIVVGALGHAIYAQSKPPLYMIGNVEVTNEEAYAKEYLPAAKKTIQDHGGVYIAAGKGIAIDGEPPKGRLVILRWESMDQLMSWIKSPEYQAAKSVRNMPNSIGWR